MKRTLSIGILSLCFFNILIFNIYSQKIKRQGIGRAEVAGNISPVEAQDIARRRAKENAIGKAGSFFLSETQLLTFSKDGISESTIRSYMDEVRAFHLRLIDREKIQHFIEDKKTIYEVRATYEFDEGRFQKEVQAYLESLQNNTFKKELKKLQDLYDRLQNPNLDPLAETDIYQQIDKLKGKAGGLYVGPDAFRHLDQGAKNKLVKINRFIRTLDNYLSEGFIRPYLVGIESTDHINIKSKSKYDLKINFSYQTKWNQKIDQLYASLPQVVTKATQEYYNKKIKKLARRYPQYKLELVEGYYLGLKTSEKRPKVIDFEFRRKHPNKLAIRISKKVFRNDYNQKKIASIMVSRRRLGSDSYDLNINPYFGRRKTFRLLIEGALKHSSENPTQSYHASLTALLRATKKYIYRPTRFGIGLGLGYDTDYGFDEQLSGFLDMRYFFSDKIITSFLTLQGGTSLALSRFEEQNFDDLALAPLVELRYGFRIKLGYRTQQSLLFSGGLQYSDSGPIKIQSPNPTQNPIVFKKQIQQLIFVFKFGLEL